MICALSIKKLTKIYPKDIKVLKNINLNINIGDFYALIGPNGAGKSTIINIITSLIKKTSGTVKIFGFDIDKNFIKAKQYLGLVPQEFNFNQFETINQILINQAGLYNIKRSIATENIKEYLNKLNLWDQRNKPALLLSGGMKRRLIIARALIHKPKLLILDEPTSGIDIKLRRIVWEILLELNNNGTTIILTTNYLEEAEMLCRNIGIINCGLLIENNTISNILLKLKSETFILNLLSNNIIPNIIRYENKIISNDILEVKVMKTQGLNDLFHQLISQGITITSIKNKFNRLEELIIMLTSEK